MMAKMFYTLDETRAALGKNEEEIKQLTREGRLREFRDGPRLMFKADQVESLKAEIGGDQVQLGPSDTGGPIGLVDSKGASGSMISLADSDVGPRGGGVMKDDTAMAGDVGLSGSAGGIPSPGRSRAGSGINLLGSDDSSADPMAQTAISGAPSDQVNLEGTGSGSGLLDLTRESDDTSLGAELLDEIAPGGTGAAAGTRAGGTAFGTRSGSAVGKGGFPPVTVKTVGGPIYVEAADPLAPAFGGLSLAAVIVSLLGIAAVSAGALGAKPALLSFLESGGKALPLLYIFGGAAVLGIIFFVVGLLIGRR
jgi:hypothetical protein